MDLERWRLAGPVITDSDSSDKADLPLWDQPDIPGTSVSLTGGPMPLTPYRVLDLTDDRGQYAGFILRQLGAEVICLEPPDGQRSRRLGPFTNDESSENSSLFHWSYNRGKRSVVIDHSDQLAHLAEGADVVIECGSLPVDLGSLQAVNPALITVSITPFGQHGPKANWLATDLTVAAASGVMALTGDKDRPPVRIGHPQSWLCASADAAAAVTIALYERRQSGLGQHIDVSAQQSMIAATQFSTMSALVGGQQATRVAGGLELEPFQLRFVYPCNDGHVSVTYLFGNTIGPYTNRLFKWIHEEGFCDVELGTKDWINYAMEVLDGTSSIDDLETASRAIEAWARTHDMWDLVTESMERGALVAPINTTRDLLEMEQLATRKFWLLTPVPGMKGLARLPGPMVRMQGTPVGVLGAPPHLGEHTAQVRSEPSRLPAAPPPSSDWPARPLEGLKICDLMWALAGPAATRTLADFGATVVRIESESRGELLRAAGPFRDEQGDPEGSLQYHSANAGKYQLALNLAVPEARGVLEDLVRWADVITESFTPRGRRKLDLDYNKFAKINPGIIMLSSCLMGQTGPLSDYAGFGTAGAAMGGFYPITGWPDRLPAGPYTAYTDYVSPRVTVAALLAAVDHRDRTGRGQYIDFSQIESSIHMLAPLLLDDEINGRIAGRNGNRDPHMAPHVVVQCGHPGQDQWLAVACETDEQWATLAVIIGADAFASLTLSQRLERVELLEDRVAAWAGGKDPEKLQEQLQTAGVPAHQVQNSAELVADPQLQLREHYRQVPHQMYGDSWVEGPAYVLSRTPGGPSWAGPTLGEHSHQVVTEFLGYDDDQFTQLVMCGALS
jgi:crotonobetainyl-CoA:carnitine CoA-transferase CaiB-like acyl-CoA transferase